ncbi:MAG: S8/S53 family peptidase [Bacteroidota bacterium]
MIDIEKAWDFSTGGISPNGDTIVIAILDSGCDLDHEDIQDNLWKNKAEIPNDGIDNDGNGYTDDYLGINLRRGDDNHNADSHGTPVTGIIGAKGNNTEGVSGINWNIKLMIISNVTTVAEIIEGYEYVLDQRIKYNQSNGAEGAYVVATNFSAGVDNRFPEEFPTWCNVFNTLGKAGILNVCSVTNSNRDVELAGDLPTLCPSPYLISVTNTDRFDRKVSDAGFGNVSVDLGAPGEGALSTYPNDRYFTFEGTSSAAPHVSGVIGLLFSINACDKYSSLMRDNPATATSLVKQLILDGTDSITDLEGRSVSGGRLNAFNSANLINDFCIGGSSEASIKSIFPNPTNDFLNIEYTSPSAENFKFEIYNSLSQLISEQVTVPSFFSGSTIILNTQNLSPGTYLLKLTDGEEELYEKFVVAR